MGDNLGIKIQTEVEKLVENKCKTNEGINKQHGGKRVQTLVTPHK